MNTEVTEPCRVYSAEQIVTEIARALKPIQLEYTISSYAVERLTFLQWVFNVYNRNAMEDGAEESEVWFQACDEDMHSHVRFVTTEFAAQLPDRNNTVRRLQRCDRLNIYQSDGNVVIDCEIHDLWEPLAVFGTNEP